MKKTLLTLFTLVAAMFTASAQTNLIENGDFETWKDGAPVNWKSTTSASSAKLTQSKVAHGGSFSVLIEGNAKSNKRIAYKEISLKPGTYTVKAFAKATTADTAGIKLGYVTVKDGKVGTYVYQKDATDLVDDWTTLTYEFELTETTQLNLIAMNSKAPKGVNKYGKDILFDDYSITTTNGGIAEGGDVNPDPTPDPEPQPQPQPEEGVAFSADFATDACGFTFDDKSLSEGLKFVWSYSEKYHTLKATAAIGKDHTPHASESWAVSPVIDLTKIQGATLTFINKANFFGSAENFQKACAVKAKAEGTTEWKDIVVEGAASGMSWDKVTSTADLKAFDGKKIQIAFVYTSTTEFAGTWEFVNVKVAGKGGEVNPNPEPQPEDGSIFSADFATDACGFTFDDKSLSEGLKFVWSYSEKYHTLKATAAIGKDHTPHASESWAVSPVIDLTKAQNTTMTFINKANFFGSEEGFKKACAVKVKAEGSTEWKDVVVEGAASGMSWDKVTSTADLKAFDGKKIQIAFVYTSTAEVAGTWEFVNIQVKANTATGIESVENENGAQVIYDLAGRRVAKAVKGLYIINGKKVFVK